MSLLILLNQKLQVGCPWANIAHGSTLFNLHHLKYFLSELLTHKKNQVISRTSLDFLTLFEISDGLEKWTWHSQMVSHGWNRILAPCS